MKIVVLMEMVNKMKPLTKSTLGLALHLYTLEKTSGNVF